MKTQPHHPKLDTPLPHAKHFVLEKKDMVSTDFQLEYMLARSCLQELSFSSSVYGFKKAEAISKTLFEKNAATYGLIWTYFHAKKWEDLKKLYFSSSFHEFNPNIPFYKDALLMFYIAFSELKSPFVIQEIKSLLVHETDVIQKLNTYEDLIKNPFSSDVFLKLKPLYNQHAKSPLKAGLLNLGIFGSGYAYLGQYQSALTAFCLLFLLGWAFRVAILQKSFGVAFLLFSIFTGFYWGSIVGSTQAAEFYNQSLYTHLVDPFLKQQTLYPELLITYAP